MCSLWRENYSKDIPSLSYKIAYFHSLTTLLPSISLPFLPSIHKKMEFLHYFPQKVVYL